MSQLAERPPRTIIEVYKMLPEGTLAELVDGIIYMSPSPSTDHQRLIFKISRQLAEFSEKHNLGEVFISPYDVYLDEHSNAVQPDIVFVSRNNSSIIQDHIHGVPDLLIELTSPGNKTHDTIVKKALYEKFGVKEYWIIDPSTKDAIGYQLVNTKFIEIKQSTGTINSVLLNHSFGF